EKVTAEHVLELVRLLFDVEVYKNEKTGERLIFVLFPVDGEVVSITSKPSIQEDLYAAIYNTMIRALDLKLNGSSEGIAVIKCDNTKHPVENALEFFGK